MSGTALICDDTAFMRSLIRQVLAGGGYDVVGEAGSGAEALRLYEELRPDFVTMDVVMPNENGVEIVRRLLAHHPGARIIMITAVGQESLVEEAMEAGAIEFVVKPFEPSRLLDAVRHALKKG